MRRANAAHSEASPFQSADRTCPLLRSALFIAIRIILLSFLVILIIGDDQNPGHIAPVGIRVEGHADACGAVPRVCDDEFGHLARHHAAVVEVVVGRLERPQANVLVPLGVIVADAIRVQEAHQGEAVPQHSGRHRAPPAPVQAVRVEPAGRDRVAV
eukprot:CAMPEP_0114518558 /NCGR_PEP_ID=MMETSP0109-20121206/18509_1 /TAXON_ID=29199 /ORGANISM="Chlorarachnion reptans, Strain CCCM449" /LENGTH=156 /DNA_ID=CAMNT_0001699189 /DNA_START=241 /DNA_END=708 /DNA_ORIENTATION=-